MNAIELNKMNDLMRHLNELIIAAQYTPSRGRGIAGVDGWAGFEVMARGEGFKLLGLGHFAAAFEHEDLKGYAIKVGFKKDDSGAAYAAYCRANQGRVGIPVIHGVKRFSRAYMVGMDKLRSLQDIGGNYCRECDTYEQQVLDFSWRVVHSVIDYGSLPHEATTEYLDMCFNGDTDPIAHIEKQYVKDLAETARGIHQFFYSLAAFDTHRGNVMVDNAGRLVITDPVSWTNEDHEDNLKRLSTAEMEYQRN